MIGILDGPAPPSWLPGLYSGAVLCTILTPIFGTREDCIRVGARRIAVIICRVDIFRIRFRQPGFRWNDSE